MAKVTDRVIEEVLPLPADARLNLIERLLTSLNLPVDEKMDRLWAEEAERRVAQIEAGEAKLVAGVEVFSKIRAKQSRKQNPLAAPRKRRQIRVAEELPIPLGKSADEPVPICPDDLLRER